jgi:WD40 repeat protein
MSWLRRLYLAVTELAVVVGLASPAAAGYTMLPIPGREDFVFDRSGILYITDGSSIDRYDTQSNSFLTSISVGGQLLGIDLSPDGQTVAVADTGRTGIDLINTATGGVTPVNFTPAFGEGGTYTVAWGSDGKLLVTSEFNGSGWVPLRQYDPNTNTTTTLASVRQDTMLTPSAIRNMIGLAQANQTGGPIGVYSVNAATLVAQTSVSFWFTFAIAVNANGTQFVVPTYNGAYVYSRSGSILTQETILGQYASHGPIDAVFSPVSPYLFTSEYDYNGHLSGVKVYNTQTWQQVASLDNYNFPWSGNSALGDGTMQVSPDGDTLAVSVSGGIRIYDVSAYGVPEPSSLALGFSGLVVLGLTFALSKGLRDLAVGPLWSPDLDHPGMAAAAEERESVIL